MKTILLTLLLLFNINSIAQNNTVFTCFVSNTDTVNVVVYEMKYDKVKDSLIYDSLKLKSNVSERINSSIFRITLPSNKYYMIVFNNNIENRDIYINAQQPTNEIGFEIDINFSLSEIMFIRYNYKQKIYEYKTIPQ